MNIYLLKQTQWTRGAGYYNSCVVAANSEQEARTIHPCDMYRWSGIKPNEPWESKSWSDWRNHIDWDNLTEPTDFDKSDDWVNDLNKIEVTLLGVAEPNITKGVINSSYFSYE